MTGSADWRSPTPADTAPVPELSAAEFRAAMGHFATGVTVVTSVDSDGEPVGTTANAVTSLSLDPPLVIVCFDLGSLTLRAIRGHGAFVVNVLAAPQQRVLRLAWSIRPAWSFRYPLGNRILRTGHILHAKSRRRGHAKTPCELPSHRHLRQQTALR